MHQQLQPTSGAECRWRNDSLQGTAIIQTVLASKANKIGDKNLGACNTPKRVLSWISDLHRESWWWSYRRRTWGYSCPEFGKENYQKGHHVHMENFFSPRFFTDLYAEEVYCCGTVRGNRKCMLEGIKSCKLKNHDEIIKFFRKMSSSLRHWGTKKLCLIC